MDKEGIEFLKKKIVDLYEWMEEGAEGNCLTTLSKEALTSTR